MQAAQEEVEAVLATPKAGSPGALPLDTGAGALPTTEEQQGSRDPQDWRPMMNADLPGPGIQ